MNDSQENEKELAPVRPEAFQVTVSLALIGILALKIGFNLEAAMNNPFWIFVVGHSIVLGLGLMVAQYVSSFRNSALATILAIVVIPIYLVYSLQGLVAMHSQFQGLRTSGSAWLLLLHLSAMAISLVALMVNAQWYSVLRKAGAAGAPLGRSNAFSLYEIMGLTAVLALMAFPFRSIAMDKPPVIGSQLSESKVPFDVPVGATQIHFIKHSSGDIVAQWIAPEAFVEIWLDEKQADPRTKQFVTQEVTRYPIDVELSQLIDLESDGKGPTRNGKLAKWKGGSVTYEVMWTPGDPLRRVFYRESPSK